MARHQTYVDQLNPVNLVLVQSGHALADFERLADAVGRAGLSVSEIMNSPEMLESERQLTEHLFGQGD